jgi:hypothetical protein
MVIKRGHFKTAILHLEYSKEKDFTIKLRDESSAILIEEQRTATRKFTKKYNLNNLPKGNYFFEVEDDNSITAHEVQIEYEGIKILGQKRIIYKPTFKQIGNKISLSMLILDSSEVEINVLDDNNNQVYSETIKNQMKLEKLLNFSALEQGKDLIRIRHKGYHFLHPFSINRF